MPEDLSMCYLCPCAYNVHVSYTYVLIQLHVLRKNLGITNGLACPASLYPICVWSEARQGYLPLQASLRLARRTRGRLTGQSTDGLVWQITCEEYWDYSFP